MLACFLGLMNPVLYTDAEAAATCTSDGVHVCQCVVLQMQNVFVKMLLYFTFSECFFNVFNCLLMITFFLFFWVLVCM